MSPPPRTRRFRIRTILGLIASCASCLGHVGAAAVQCEPPKLLASDGAPYAFFGSAACLDGDVAVIGAPGDGENGIGAGAAYVYRFDGSNWIQEAKLVASDGAEEDRFGRSACVSGDVAIIGADQDDDNGSASGAAYVYRFDGSMWIEEAKILPGDGREGDFFGSSVSISGDAAIVGATGDDDNGLQSGAAYIFRFDRATWVEEAKVIASDGEPTDRFGNRSGISGNVAIVAARFANDGAGAAYVYRFDGAAWTEEAKLVASDRMKGDEFGHAAAIRGDLAIVGADQDADNGRSSGSAYIYRFDGATWIEEAKLLPRDGSANRQFGWSVAVNEDSAAVGSVRDNAGAVHVFRHENGSWNEQVKILTCDGAAGDGLGYAVSISGDSVLAGAREDDDRGESAGSAYVFPLTLTGESLCPSSPNDFDRQLGGATFGDALDLCESDDVRLEVLQSAPVDTLLPFIRLEYWTHTAFADRPLCVVDYVIECRISALVPGGQSADTLRTYVRNYVMDRFELIDTQATGWWSDRLIRHRQCENAGNYVRSGDGEVRVRQEVFDPGDFVSPSWFLMVDLFQVTVME